MLSGCERVGLGAASISRDGDDLLVAVCQEIDVQRIYAEWSAPEHDNRSQPFLDAEGALKLSPGSILNLGSMPSGLDGDVESPDLDNATAISINFLGIRETGNLAATFGDGRSMLVISDAQWLHPNGATSTNPCR